MIFKHLLLGVLMVLAVSGLKLTHAHPQKAAITTIEKNERSGRIEIVHRFSQHDAEHAAHLFGARAESIISSDKAQKAYANYVLSTFEIYDPSGKEIKLEQVGYEFEGGYFWIYQETNISELTDELTVRYSALFDVFSDQINTVNIELDGEVKTLTFSKHSQQAKVSLD